jgi:hypothetical protein
MEEKPARMEPSTTSNQESFAVKDCALIAIATGRKVVTLRELRDALEAIPADSLYHHVWGGLLEPRFEEREYHNDFASWARHGLHDRVLAERLAMISPTDAQGLEALRAEFVDLVEQRLDESERLHWVAATLPLELLRSQIVVFDTELRLGSIEELAGAMQGLSTSSIFYHFIDARRRCSGGQDDFTAWITSLDGSHADLLADLADIDPYFSSLVEVRDALSQALNRSVGEGG